MDKKLLFSLGLAAFVLGGIFAAQAFARPYVFQGSLIDPPAPAPDFELAAHTETDFRLSDYHGRIVLLYFGYTFCPDVCPTTLYDIRRAKEKLGDRGDEIVVAMITVDPERDMPEALGDYVTTFDPDFYGLSGDPETLKSVWDSYGVYVARNQVEGSAYYLVDHTARIYVIDRAGNLRLTFPFGMAWEAMAEDLRALTEEEVGER